MLRVSCPLYVRHALALQIGSQILGYGSGGTLVFEGELDGRPVAIKRILHQFYDLAKKEIGALILSDEVSKCFHESWSCSLKMHRLSRLLLLVCAFTAAPSSLELRPWRHLPACLSSQTSPLPAPVPTWSLDRTSLLPP